MRYSTPSTLNTTHRAVQPCSSCFGLCVRTTGIPTHLSNQTTRTPSAAAQQYYRNRQCSSTAVPDAYDPSYPPKTTHTPSCAAVQRYQLLMTPLLAGDQYTFTPTPPTFLCLLTTNQTKPRTPPAVQQYSLTTYTPSSAAAAMPAFCCPPSCRGPVYVYTHTTDDDYSCFGLCVRTTRTPTHLSNQTITPPAVQQHSSTTATSKQKEWGVPLYCLL